MKKITLFVTILFCFKISFSQTISERKVHSKHFSQTVSKRALDTSDFDKSPYVGVPVFSSDGKFALYNVYDRILKVQRLFLRDIQNNRQHEIGNIQGSHHFSGDSKKAFFMKGGDSLCLLTLSNLSTDYIPEVAQFNIVQEQKAEWLVLLLRNEKRKLVFRNTITGEEHSYQDIRNFWASRKGTYIVMLKEIKSGNSVSNFLEILDINTRKLKRLWTGQHASNVLFDNDEKQIVFVSQVDSSATIKRDLWYYNFDMENATNLIPNKSNNLGDFVLDGVSGFSSDGKKLIFRVKETVKVTQPVNSSNLIIWSHSDPKLQSVQISEAKNQNKASYTWIFNFQSGKIIELENQREKIVSRDKQDNYALIFEKGEGDTQFEWYWNNTAQVQKNSYIVSLKDGSKKKLNFAGHMASVTISPTGKFLVYYDPKSKHYYSYDITKGRIKNITQNIKTKWTTYDKDDLPEASCLPTGIAAFLNDTWILIYDQSDIWQIDLSGINRPINITSFFGRKHNIVFYLMNREFDGAVKNDDEILIMAFDRKNKNNGFYKAILGKPKIPELISMWPYLFFGPPNTLVGMSPQSFKVNEKTYYLVKRMSASEFPNYYYTLDFKTFNPITNVYPEKEYNSITATLIEWKTLDSKYSQGILYKPENFDSKKKYPVIFTYYERKSDLINQFLYPLYMESDFDIPYFVSNGYLVVIPDIHYKIGYPGKSAYNSIVSAAAHISTFPWVDSKRMGLYGHSFGAFETYFIITHTKIFAAASAGAGVSNFTSAYNAIMDAGNGDGRSRQYYYEMGQSRMGVSLWQNPELYIRNSPVFYANKVTTPLLMMHNEQDGKVPFSQGIEFFTALRRLGKKVWLLQYIGEGHSPDIRENKLDYIIKIRQFFDHYLKGNPIPQWMVKDLSSN